jgi:hypothetical protein
MSFALWFLSLYNTFMNFFDGVAHLYKKICTAIYENKTYILFKDIAFPVLENLTNVESSKSALPQWKYIADQYQFFEWYPGGKTTVQNCVSSDSLPMLSMEILDGDEVIYDLTDFIAKVRVYNSTDTPSLSIEHIVAAWMLDAGTVLNPSRNYTVRYINTNAVTIELPLYGLTAEPVAEPVTEPVTEPLPAGDMEKVD